MDIIVYDIITIAEVFGDGNLFSNDSITIIESVTIYVPPDFASYLRGRPFVEITLCRVEDVELGGGYVQTIDRWGRTKKQFNIVIPISTKAEILAYRTFYSVNYNSTFYFTNPVDSIRYDVKFKGEGFTIEQIAPSTYQGRVTLVEVV
jgi:hypothetical protein